MTIVIRLDVEASCTFYRTASPTVPSGNPVSPVTAGVRAPVELIEKPTICPGAALDRGRRGLRRDHLLRHELRRGAGFRLGKVAPFHGRAVCGKHAGHAAVRSDCRLFRATSSSSREVAVPSGIGASPPRDAIVRSRGVLHAGAECRDADVRVPRARQRSRPVQRCPFPSALARPSSCCRQCRPGSVP